MSLTGRCVDLTDIVEVTTLLLAEPLAWRVRVVEQIDIDTASGTRRHRSLQSAPLRSLIRGAARIDEGDRSAAVKALLVLPIAPMPKGPLLDLDMEGPEGSTPFLLPRGEIAARELALVAKQALDASLTLSPAVRPLIESALGFTEGLWPSFGGDLGSYLAEGVGLTRQDPQVIQWLALSNQASAMLAPFADTPNRNSAVENPALVIPALLAQGKFDTPAQATEALASYISVISNASMAAGLDMSGDPAANTFLNTLVDYGLRYDLMAVVRVPLDEPFLIKVSDRRPLRLTPITNTGRQSVVIADARSNHVTLRVSDPNARLAHVHARDAADTVDAVGTFTSRKTPQIQSFYAFEDDRDYAIVLRFRVAALRRLQLVPYALVPLLLVLGVALLGKHPGPSELALLVGPGALAASILLAREPSSLGSRLRRLSTLLVTGALAALILVAVWRYTGW